MGILNKLLGTARTATTGTTARAGRTARGGRPVRTGRSVGRGRGAAPVPASRGLGGVARRLLGGGRSGL